MIHRRGELMDLSEEEAMILNVPPKTQLLEELSQEGFDNDIAQMQCKFRWDIQKEDNESLEQGEVELTPEEEKRFQELEARGDLIYSHKDKVLDLGQLRATQIKENTGITLPKSVNVKDEADLLTRSELYRSTFKRHLRSRCSK